MNTTRLLAACALLASAAAVSTPANAAGHKCSKVSSTVKMITLPGAALTAKASVTTSIISKGMSAKGQMHVKCDDNLLIAKCTASQKTCK